MARVKRRKQTYTAKAIRPYTIAIGELVLAFNDLHEAFGLIFMHATTFDVANMRQYSQLQEIWGCITSDRQKRLMVEMAINRIGQQQHRKWPDLASDILWAVEKGHSLEDQRNNVIHSPLYQNRNPIVQILLDIGPNEIIPGSPMLGHRSAKLTAATIKKKKKLLLEIRKYRDAMYALAEYLRVVNDAWMGRRRTWPERPALPKLGAKG